MPLGIWHMELGISARHAARNGHAARGGDGSASVSSVRRLAPEKVTPLTGYFLFSRDCRESLPRLDNYRISMRNLKRPSIGELQGEAVDQVSSQWPVPQFGARVHDVSASSCHNSLHNQ